MILALVAAGRNTNAAALVLEVEVAGWGGVLRLLRLVGVQGW